MTETGKVRTRESVIDESLRKVYDETLQEGIPDRFRELLEALRQQEAEKGSPK